MNDSERDMMLARIDANVGTMKEAYVAHQTDDKETHDAFDVRLTALEAVSHTQRGVVTTIVTIVSAIWALVLVAAGAVWSRS